MGEVRAVIDVGTNSVKLLVGETESGRVHPLHEESHQTRLGQGFYETRVLQKEPIQHTARTVAEFVRGAAKWKPASVRVIATSAARDALNQSELLEAIRRQCGIPVTVLSGDQEADWAFRGVLTDERFAGRDLLVMDVGGGSTEFVLGRGTERIFAQSFPIGSVRLLERLAVDDPPKPGQLRHCELAVRTILASDVAAQLRPLLEMTKEPLLVGTGGTSTILSRIELRTNEFNRDEIESIALPRDRVAAEKQRLWSMPLAQRKMVPGLPANRADVILAGVVIYDQVLEFFRLPVLQVSTRGIRFAALLQSG